MSRSSTEWVALISEPESKTQLRQKMGMITHHIDKGQYDEAEQQLTHFFDYLKHHRDVKRLVPIFTDVAENPIERDLWIQLAIAQGMHDLLSRHGQLCDLFSHEIRLSESLQSQTVIDLRKALLMAYYDHFINKPATHALAKQHWQETSHEYLSRVYNELSSLFTAHCPETIDTNEIRSLHHHLYDALTSGTIRSKQLQQAIADFLVWRSPFFHLLREPINASNSKEALENASNEVIAELRDCQWLNILPCQKGSLYDSALRKDAVRGGSIYFDGKCFVDSDAYKHIANKDNKEQIESALYVFLADFFIKNGVMHFHQTQSWLIQHFQQGLYGSVWHIINQHTRNKSLFATAGLPEENQSIRHVEFNIENGNLFLHSHLTNIHLRHIETNDIIALPGEICLSYALTPTGFKLARLNTSNALMSALCLKKEMIFDDPSLLHELASITQDTIDADRTYEHYHTQLKNTINVLIKEKRLTLPEQSKRMLTDVIIHAKNLLAETNAQKQLGELPTETLSRTLKDACEMLRNPSYQKIIHLQERVSRDVAMSRKHALHHALLGLLGAAMIAIGVLTAIATAPSLAGYAVSGFCIAEGATICAMSFFGKKQDTSLRNTPDKLNLHFDRG